MRPISRFCGNFELCRVFSKFWDFWQFQPKFRFSNLLTKLWDFFSKILTKIEIVKNFAQNRDFSKKNLQNIRTTIEILRKFALISYFPKISQIVPKIELFRKFWSISRFFEIFFLSKSRFSEKFRKKNGDFRKFRSKSIFSKNVDHNRVFQNCDQNRKFPTNFTKNRDFLKILTKIKIFENSVHNRIFAKFWPKSRFFENFRNKRDFWEIWPRSRFSKLLTKGEIFRKFSVR